MTLAEAKQQFSKQFWEEIDKNPGGVPFLRKMNEDLSKMAADGDDDGRQDDDPSSLDLDSFSPSSSAKTTTNSSGGGSVLKTDAAAAAAETSSSSTSPSSTTGAGAGDEDKVDVKTLGFWQRCTLGGLVVGVWMLSWGLSTMHWPTVWWVAQRPHALAWSQASSRVPFIPAPSHSHNAFSLNLRFDRGKYVLFIGCERQKRRVKAQLWWCE